MRALRFMATVFLSFLIIIDTIVAARLLHSGWPKTIVLSTSGQSMHVQVFPMPFGFSASVSLAMTQDYAVVVPLSPALSLPK